jgi:hypothetical protein
MPVGRPIEYTQEKEDVEIYGLVDPRTKKIMYVGKSKSAKRRFKEHCKEMRRKTPLYKWIADLLDYGMQPEMIILRKVKESDWQNVEIEEIAKRNDLLNVAKGGNQPYCSKEIRATNGRNTAKKVHGNKKSKRLWKLKHAVGISLRQGYVREDTKEKMRYLAAMRPEIFGEWASI